MKFFKILLFTAGIIAFVAIWIFVANRPIDRQDLFGFYSCYFPYTENDQSAFMLFLNKDGTYFYSCMHKKGSMLQDKGNWEFYKDDHGTPRIIFFDTRMVENNNEMPPLKNNLDTFVKRNVVGKVIIPIDYDAGMLFIKQSGD